MKNLLVILLAFIATGLFTGCAPANSAEIPSLSGNLPPTSRVPSPGNYQATIEREAVSMRVPTPE